MIDGYASGILAALGAPLVMTTGFLLWQDHWKGSAFALNLFKCCTASVLFLILSLTVPSLQRDVPDNEEDGDIIVRDDHTLFPSTVFTTRAVGFLFLSSTLGIVIGDWTWLEALQLLGARPVILMDALKPFLASLMGWWLLGEELRVMALGGMVLTVVGILVVALEQEQQNATTSVGPQHQGTTVEDSSMNETMRSEPSDGLQEPSSPISDGIDDCAIVQLNSLYCGETNEPNQQKTHRAVDRHGEADDKVRFDAAMAVETDDNVSLTEGTEVADCEDPFRPAIHRASSFPPSSSSEDLLTSAAQQKKRVTRIGYTYSAINVILDTYGSVLTKQNGMYMTVWEINLLRFGFAGAVLAAMSLIMHTRAWLMASWRKEPSPQNDCIKSTPWYALPRNEMNRSSWLHISAGVVVVTFLSPTLANYALFEIALALALTLTSIGPLYELPLSYLFNKKRPTLQSFEGAVLAIAGVAILAFRGSLPDDNDE